MRKLLYLLIAIFFIIGIITFTRSKRELIPEERSVVTGNSLDETSSIINENQDIPVNGNSELTRAELLKNVPKSETLLTTYFAFQTFNNCGPAALAIDLSHYGINETQESLGKQIRPYQVKNGDNDDKTVTLDELAAKAEEFGFTVYHRPNGNIDTLKLFIANDIPVIAKTWLKENEDIGHFRVVKGYDDTKQELIQDDSYDGKNLSFSYKKFNAIWDKFNYEYMVLVPKDKEKIAEEILAENYDYQNSWELAVKNAKAALEKNPDDAINGLNLLVSLYRVGDYQGVVTEYEKIENKLPPRTLWYHIEPIKSYYELGNYDKVFSLTDRIINNGNRAYSELYIIRGDIYFKQGDYNSAKDEYTKAVFYNVNLKAAKDALQKVNEKLSVTN